MKFNNNNNNKEIKDYIKIILLLNINLDYNKINN